MTDKKISALTAATTPLSGTEVLPIVQGGQTVKVAVSNLTAGRNVSVADLTASGQLAVGTASPASGAVLTLQESSSNGAAFSLRNRNSTQTWTIAVDAAAVDDKILAFIDSSVSQVRMTLTDTGNLIINTAGKGVTLPGGITWTSGSGSPEGVVNAPVGSLFSRSDGGMGTSLYVKESGSGNTGWVGK